MPRNCANPTMRIVTGSSRDRASHVDRAYIGSLRGPVTKWDGTSRPRENILASLTFDIRHAMEKVKTFTASHKLQHVNLGGIRDNGRMRRMKLYLFSAAGDLCCGGRVSGGGGGGRCDSEHGRK